LLAAFIPSEPHCLEWQADLSALFRSASSRTHNKLLCFKDSSPRRLASAVRAPPDSYAIYSPRTRAARAAPVLHERSAQTNDWARRVHGPFIAAPQYRLNSACAHGYGCVYLPLVVYQGKQNAFRIRVTRCGGGMGSYDLFFSLLLSPSSLFLERAWIVREFCINSSDF